MEGGVKILCTVQKSRWWPNRRDSSIQGTVQLRRAHTQSRDSLSERDRSQCSPLASAATVASYVFLSRSLPTESESPWTTRPFGEGPGGISSAVGTFHTAAGKRKAKPCHYWEAAALVVSHSTVGIILEDPQSDFILRAQPYPAPNGQGRLTCAKSNAGLARAHLHLTRGGSSRAGGLNSRRGSEETAPPKPGHAASRTGLWPNPEPTQVLPSSRQSQTCPDTEPLSRWPASGDMRKALPVAVAPTWGCCLVPLSWHNGQRWIALLVREKWHSGRHFLCAAATGRRAE